LSTDLAAIVNYVQRSRRRERASEHARAPRHGGSCKQATDGQTGSCRYTLTLNYIIVSYRYTAVAAVTTRTPTTTATTTPTTTTIRTTTKYTATYPWYDYDRAAAGEPLKPVGVYASTHRQHYYLCTKICPGAGAIYVVAAYIVYTY